MPTSPTNEIDSRGDNPFANLTPEMLDGLEGKCIAVGNDRAILVSADSHREMQTLMRKTHPGIKYNSLCLPIASSEIMRALVDDGEQFGDDVQQ